MVSSAKRTIKACVFDLGNTLINDSLLSRNAAEDMSRWLLERALISSSEDFLTTFRRINYGTNKPFISHTFGEAEFFQKTFAELGVKAISAEEALETYRKLLMDRIEPDPGIAETFTFLRDKGIRVALLSNERTVRVDAYLEKTKLGPFFDAIVVSESIGVEKPDPRIFQEVLTRLQCQGRRGCHVRRQPDCRWRQQGMGIPLRPGYRLFEPSLGLGGGAALPARSCHGKNHPRRNGGVSIP